MLRRTRRGNDNLMITTNASRFLARLTAHRRLVLRCAALAPFMVLAFVVACCSGPQPLSVAIKPADESAYVEKLNAAQSDGRSAWLALKAEQEKLSLAELRDRDAALAADRNPFDAYRDPGAVSRGAVIYKFHCARCHGEDGRGRGPSVLPNHPANDFHAPGQRFASTLHRGAPRRWFNSIMNGYGVMVDYPDGKSPAMPAFKERLSREQVWLVITYLQSLDMYATKNPQS